jgi:hypothetical protein
MRNLFPHEVIMTPLQAIIEILKPELTVAVPRFLRVALINAAGDSCARALQATVKLSLLRLAAG